MDSKRNVERLIFLGIIVVKKIKKYNYIRFATREEIDTNMPLTITPEPDTTIRVLMEYKGLENSIKVEEQSLETPGRKELCMESTKKNRKTSNIMDKIIVLC